MAHRRWLVALVLVLAIARPAAAQCGGDERWSVKVGSDTAANSISLSAAIPTLLHDLISLTRPTLPSDDVTRTTEERSVRTVSGRLVQFTRESGRTGDEDYHLVITDDTLQFSKGGSGTQPVPHSFVAEIVNPSCISGRQGTLPSPSHFQAEIASVRSKFEQQFPNITGGWNQGGGIPVQVTGVVFFDRPHGQTGRAMNGLEIHPVTSITFGTAVPPGPPPPAAPSLIVNPGFETGTQGWTATAGVITDDSREPAHTGTRKAWLGGYGVPHTDRLSQQVSIPATATTATLAFFVHISTEEQALQVFDTLTVRIKNASGQVQTLKIFSNREAASGFSLQSFSLNAYRGKTISIELVAQEDNGSMTSFVVDDFTIVIEGT